MDALFVLADLVAPDADLVDLLADLTLGALILADLVLPSFDLYFFSLPSTSVAEACDLLLPFVDSSTTISPFLVLFLLFPDPFALRDFVDFLD
jgi:hypothetical protein